MRATLRVGNGSLTSNKRLAQLMLTVSQLGPACLPAGVHKGPEHVSLSHMTSSGTRELERNP